MTRLNNAPMHVLTHHSILFFSSNGLIKCHMLEVRETTGKWQITCPTPPLTVAWFYMRSNPPLTKVGQTVGSSLRNNDLMIQCCAGQYSYCVAANTRSLKYSESFLTIHSAFRNYWSLFVPERASPVMSPEHVVEKPDLPLEPTLNNFQYNVQSLVSGMRLQ